MCTVITQSHIHTVFNGRMSHVTLYALKHSRILDIIKGSISGVVYEGGSHVSRHVLAQVSSVANNVNIILTHGRSVLEQFIFG